MYKLGLKLWSINTDYYYDEAKKLYDEVFFDFIELYVVPDTLDCIEKWKRLKIPFAIHAPHYAHGMNFSKNECMEYNSYLINQTKIYTESLNALYTVFHPGIGGEFRETLRQMKQIKDFSFLVENKPYIVPITKTGCDDFCIGSEVEQIAEIMGETGCGFCFDIGHALCCANYLKKDVLEYLKLFNNLNPTTYHISDNIKTSIYDRHLHLGCGTIDFSIIRQVISPNKFIAVETNKDSKESLDDYRIDVEYLKGVLNE